MRYYRLHDDVRFPERWHLGDIDDATLVDNWAFTTPGLVPPAPSTVGISSAGREMDFTETGAFGVPIVSAKFKAALSDIAGVSFLPIRVLSGPRALDYFVLYIEHEVACVDEENSIFEKFTPDDPVRPDLAGHYRAFLKLVIDESRTAQSGLEIFRVARAHNLVVVSESLQNRILAAGVTGAAFREAW